MEGSHFDRLSDGLLVAIFWPAKRLSSRPQNDDTLWTTVQPSPIFLRERADEPCYQMSDTLFPAATLPAVYADAAYNLLLAATCRRWRRLAQHHVTTLLFKANRAVSLEDLGAAVECFPNLTHLHLSDRSVDDMDDDFFARLGASCPKLTAFHLGNRIVQQPRYRGWVGMHLNGACLNSFFRHCTRLEHLSLGCLSEHFDFELPASIFKLVHLRSLALADLTLLTNQRVCAFSSLAALAFNAYVEDYLDLGHLPHLPRLTSLSLPAGIAAYIKKDSLFSFADLQSLKSLDMRWAVVPWDLLFPPHSPHILLERLTICDCHAYKNLPDDIGDRLPYLRELTISKCMHFSEQPQQVTSMTNLRKLTLSDCPFQGLPDSLGVMPNLKALVLHHLDLGISFPDSCSQLLSLESLIVTECESLVNLPHPLGALTALKTLGIAGSPLVTLPNDIGDLPNLETVFLKQYRAQQLLPPSFTALTSLTRLELQDCALVQLPDAMGELGGLRELYVVGCSQLQALPKTVSALVRLEALVVDKCSSLSSVPRKLPNLTRLAQLELTGCEKLWRAPDFLPRSLEILRLGSSGKLIQLWDTYTLPSLKTASMNRVLVPLSLSSCLSSLEHLHLILAFGKDFPFPLTALPCLRSLTFEGADVIRLPDFSTSTLQELRRLELCLPELTEIPATIAAIWKLTYLKIDASRLPSLPHSFGELSRLCKLILLNCPALTCFPFSHTQLSSLRVLRVHENCVEYVSEKFEHMSRRQN